jgi:hypothetical protein
MGSLLWRAGVSLAASLLGLLSLLGFSFLSAPLALFAKAQPIKIGDDGQRNRGHRLYSP